MYMRLEETEEQAQIFSPYAGACFENGEARKNLSLQFTDFH
jgi:hypothetical protein